MEILWLLLRVFLMIALVCLMAIPLLLEFLSFRKDKKNEISDKRFRILLFTVVYFIVVAIVMTALKDLFYAITSWPLLTRIAGFFTTYARIDYAVSVFFAILLNFGIGLLFWFLLRFVRMGLAGKDLSMPRGKNGDFTLLQKIERAILRFFKEEYWFFVGKILKFLCLTLSALYAVLFLVYQLPIFFGAAWIPYGILSQIFDAGYLYPMLTLLPLYEAWFFLGGLEYVESKCPELQKVPPKTADHSVDVEEVNNQCRKLFKNFFRCQLEDLRNSSEISTTDCLPVTRMIADGIEGDQRNPHPAKPGYIKCLDVIVRNDLHSLGIKHDKKSVHEGEGREVPTGVIVNGGFFSEFSAYFLRYLSTVLARGDNVVFVCNDNVQIHAVAGYVTQAMEELYSLYPGSAVTADAVDDSGISLDHPVWNVCAVSGERSNIDRVRIDDCSILVTDLPYLCSADFEKNHSAFSCLIDTVIFVDVLNSVNQYPRQMSLFDTNLRNVREEAALRARNSSKSSRSKTGDPCKNDAFRVRYTSKQIKYVCFDDSRAPGLDRVLKNLLSAGFKTADAMDYSPATTVCCYDFEGRPDENGKIVLPQSAMAVEELGVLVNISDYAVSFGAETVSLFADKRIPFGDFRESVHSNANNGFFANPENQLFFNTPLYNPDHYNVIVAFDGEDNLPAVIRRYAAMTSDRPALVMVFSRPYLLRDYYAANINGLWQSEQLLRIPVEKSRKQDALHKILVQASAGGISMEETCAILSNANLKEYEELQKAGDFNGILWKILGDCDVPRDNGYNLYDYFEFDSRREFGKDGVFVAEDKVRLRKHGTLYDYVKGRNMIRLVTPKAELLLPIPKDRITQNFIVGQNMLYDGNVYVINNLDPESGKIYVSRVTGGRNNVSYQYLPDREYYVHWSSDADRVYPTKHMTLGAGDDVRVEDVYLAVYRRPMEVLTKGYTPINHRTLALNGADALPYEDLTCEGREDAFRQTYRRYGRIVPEEAVCSSDTILSGKGSCVSSENGALVMSLKMTGSFGENAPRIASLAAAMLHELMRSVFPSVADSVAVCPVLPEGTDLDVPTAIRTRLPKAFCRGYSAEPGCVELLIIEDCPSDIGVISVLMSSGDHVLRTLFDPICKYLNWYSAAEEKSPYLYYGGDAEPACFDFAGLTKLANLLCDENYEIQFVPIEEVALCDTCDFCGKRYPKGPDVTALPDGRKMCRECAAKLVGNHKRVLKEHLDRARIFLESSYGISLDNDYEFCFESTVNIVNSLRQHPDFRRRGADLPLKSYVDEKKKVHVEYELPSANLSELLVRELSHVWQIKHLPNLEEGLAEGLPALVGIQYLRFLGHDGLASARSTYYESNGSLSGEGYRKLVRELLANPQYKNNPFLYLSEYSGGSEKPVVRVLTPRVIGAGEYGKPYVPTTPDRTTDGSVPYFYYARLSLERQALYDAMLDGIRDFAEVIPAEGGVTSADVDTVSECIAFDHPELFWYKIAQLRGSEIRFWYGATATEAEEIRRRIDEVVPKYLDGITDAMSAYDVALRMHVKLISSVDYDTVSLNREKAAGGPKLEEIDRLRSIYGVFLDGKAVCEGYARALQYLLQKCGVECAEAAGNIIKDTGELGGGHAWNIIKIDGDYYYIDTTWDDSSNTVQTVKSNDLGFDYFCITEEELLRTRDLKMCPLEMPKCEATKANYFYHNGYVLETYDLNKIRAIAQIAIENKADSFSFKCTTREVYETALNKLCADGKDGYDLLKVLSKTDKKLDVNRFRYGWNKNLRTVTFKFQRK